MPGRALGTIIEAVVDLPAPSRSGKLREFVRRHGRQILLWLVLILFVAVGMQQHWKGSVIAATAMLWGLVTHIFGVVFAATLTWVGAFPIAGPIIVKVLTWPLFLLINGAAFFTSLIGVNIGKGQKVFEAKVAATILMAGVLIGFLLGKLF